MEISTVGLLYPGQMGATVGAAASRRTRVVWASQGRSEETRRRADEAGLHNVDSLTAVAKQAGLIFCVCPPNAALAVARSVIASGFDGIYVDANAIAPGTSRAIGSTLSAGGVRFVDGGIIGPPAKVAGTTRLYLSGEDAAEVAQLFAGSALEAIPMNAPVGAASALKMCYAAWTKGSDAMLLAIRALAAAEGVDRDLLAEWAISQAGIEARSERAAANNAFKAWRFVGEMHEIADTFAGASLPDGFHRGAAEIYRRLECYRNAATVPELSEVVRVIMDADGDEADDMSDAHAT